MNYFLHHFTDSESSIEAVAIRWHEALVKRDPAIPFTVALSGGRTPKALYKAFVAKAQKGQFENVHFFWGDERVVPPEDDESNYKLAVAPLFDSLDIPETQIHRLLTERDEEFAVQQAESEICRFAKLDSSGQPVLDLVFLGMGEDGHVASLFPDDQEAIESKAIYRAVTCPKPPPRRITLGYLSLYAAREVWVLVNGEGKKQALADSLSLAGTTPFARVLQNRKNTEIFTDFILE